MSRGLANVERACAAAAAAVEPYRAASYETRASLLETIGEEIRAIGDTLVETASRESRLPRARIEGERGRTVAQLKLFADVVRRKDFLGLRIDPAQPDRKPLPKPDLRLRLIPIGPVAVFGASNFPLAFSTAGGDTASALAAGCPVVVKAHPAHPETSVLVAGAIERAVRRSGLPEGVFNHVEGFGNEIGAALVCDSRIAAVGFTGSRSGGLALQKLAQARHVPIPVFAEMSSVNPVVLLPAALRRRSAELATEFVASMTLGAGQFCTNPGLVLGVESEGLSAFEAAAAVAVAAAPAADMLHAGIFAAFEDGVRQRSDSAAQCIARGKTGDRAEQGAAALFAASAKDFLSDGRLGEEVFGATSLIVCCKDEAELKQVLQGIEGQLTSTLHADADDRVLAQQLVAILERKCGRILCNGWPTGVEVTHAMVHGGPYPATTDGRTTSVGSLAINRFLRPVSYQNLPEDLLPDELRDGAGVPVMMDGLHQ